MLPIVAKCGAKTAWKAGNFDHTILPLGCDSSGLIRVAIDLPPGRDFWLEMAESANDSYVGDRVCSEGVTTSLDKQRCHPFELGRPLLIARFDREDPIAQRPRFAVLRQLLAYYLGPVDEQRVDAFYIGETKRRRQIVECV